MAKDSHPDPGPRPDKEPGCTCSDFILSKGHWAQVVNNRCPVHGLFGGEEDE